MTNWTDMKPLPNRFQKYEDIFKKLDPTLIKHPFDDTYLSIKAFYEERGFLTEKQMAVVDNCNRYARPKSGVSPRTFRGLSRVIHEGIY